MWWKAFLFSLEIWWLFKKRNIVIKYSLFHFWQNLTQRKSLFTFLFSSSFFLFPFYHVSFFPLFSIPFFHFFSCFIWKWPKSPLFLVNFLSSLCKVFILDLTLKCYFSLITQSFKRCMEIKESLIVTWFN
jgi:hypothetical protein